MGGAGAAASRPRRCVNCGSDKHLARECPLPAQPPERRPCFQCGKTGHISPNCRGGGAGGKPSVRLVDDTSGELPSFGGGMACVMEADEYTEVKHGGAQRTPATPADFIPKPVEIKNAFPALASDADSRP